MKKQAQLLGTHAKQAKPSAEPCFLPLLALLGLWGARRKYGGGAGMWGSGMQGPGAGMSPWMMPGGMGMPGFGKGWMGSGMGMPGGPWGGMMGSGMGTQGGPWSTMMGPGTGMSGPGGMMGPGFGGMGSGRWPMMF